MNDRLQPRQQLVSILRGMESRADATGVSAAEALAVAEDEGVVSLVADALRGRPVADPWRTAFVERGRSLAAIDLLREGELRALLEQCDAAGVRCVLMKGAHLAYGVYQRPDLRPRLDTDLLVPPSARHQAETVLVSAGYRKATAQQEGDLLMYQATFVKESPSTRHVVDLHWRALNPQAFANVFETEALFLRAAPLPSLSPGARGLGLVDALLLAAVHRVAHHRRVRPLIWTYDIHLLAQCLDQTQWRELVDRAQAAGVGAVLHRSLVEATTDLGTPVPPWVTSMTAGCDAGTLAPYLRASRHAELVVEELRVLPDWGSRVRLAMQYAFPAATYMRGTYARGSHLPLPWLYLSRIVRGGGRWLRRS